MQWTRSIAVITNKKVNLTLYFTLSLKFLFYRYNHTQQECNFVFKMNLKILAQAQNQGEHTLD